MFQETVELQVGKIWKEVRGGRGSQTFFAAAGDIQAKPTRVSGGLDLLVYFLYPRVVKVTIIIIMRHNNNNNNYYYYY
jgi:hypothetical protein